MLSTFLVYIMQIKYSTSQEGLTERPLYRDPGQEMYVDKIQHSLVIAHQLKPNMDYQFDIRARTKSGLSDPAVIFVRTRISGKCRYIFLSYLYYILQLT